MTMKIHQIAAEKMKSTGKICPSNKIFLFYKLAIISIYIYISCIYNLDMKVIIYKKFVFNGFHMR